jgi:hypothetical protein
MTSMQGILRVIGGMKMRPKKGRCPRCHGSKKIMLMCRDPQCGDGTWDHYCKLGQERLCPICKGTGKRTHKTQEGGQSK